MVVAAPKVCGGSLENKIADEVVRENELKHALDRIKDNSIIRQEIRSRDIKDDKPHLPSPAKEVWQMDSKFQSKMVDERGGGRYTIHVKKSNKNLDAEFKQMEQR